MKVRKNLDITPALRRQCRSGKQEAFAAVDGPAALARRLGISKQAVSHWEIVPAEKLVAVEEATRVHRHRLRPDIFRGYVRAEEALARKRT